MDPTPAAHEVPGVDVEALEAHLRAWAPGLLTGPLRGQLLAGGRSNLTYLLTDGSQRWVLRRPPLGAVAETAHDVAREHRLLAALHGTRVPVPRPLLLGTADLLGVPFYVMEFAEGAVLRERRQLDALSGAQPAALADDLVDVLAELHQVRPADVGLADLGRPEGYLARQLVRWDAQLVRLDSPSLLRLRRLGQRLSADVPHAQRVAVVHGDYRVDNVVVDLATMRVSAVLDWEMATLGDPLADLGTALLWWDGLRGLGSPVAAVPGDVPGFPDGRRLVERYAARTGLDLARLPWYSAFAAFKVAAIFAGIAERHRRGLTVGEGFERIGAMVPALVSLGEAAADG